jgi:hypothetical protein
MKPVGECHVIQTTESTQPIDLTRLGSCWVDATPEALWLGIAMTVPVLFFIMESVRWTIRVGRAVGLARIVQANLSLGGDRRKRLIGSFCMNEAVLFAASDRGWL